MKYQITLLEKGHEPLGAALDVNFLEGKKLSEIPQVCITIGDGSAEGSIRLPINVLNMLMAKVMEAAAARQSGAGLLVPDTALVGPNGEKLL